MKTKTHFAFRVDIWDDTGDSIIEHIAGIEDFEVAEATYGAAVTRWPMARITLPDDLGGVPRRKGRAPALNSGALHAALQAVQIIACSSVAAPMSERVASVQGTEVATIAACQLGAALV